MIGRLYHLPTKVARARASELIAELGLEDAGDRLVKDYSGGMRRRLDLAASLVASPRSSSSTSRPPASTRKAATSSGTLLRQLVGGGTTVILTTQYLEEADQLADDVVLLDHGKIVATGTPTQLKAQHGGERVVVTVDAAAELAAAARALERVAAGSRRDRRGRGSSSPPRRANRPA